MSITKDLSDYQVGQLVSPSIDKFKTANKIAGYYTLDGNKYLDKEISLPESTSLTVNAVTTNSILVGDISMTNSSGSELNAPNIATSKITAVGVEDSNDVGGINVEFDQAAGAHYFDLDTGNVSTKLTVGASSGTADANTIKAKADEIKLDGKIECFNTLNINNPEKYKDYPNRTHVNGLYVYAIHEINDTTLRVYLTADRQAFLNSLNMVLVSSSSEETKYRGRFKEITDESPLTEEELEKIVVKPFGEDYSAYLNVYNETGYTLYLSLFAWNDKINLCWTSHDSYTKLVPKPSYIELKASKDTITNILTEGLGTVSRDGSETDPDLFRKLFSWFKGLLIPTGYSTGANGDLIYKLWENDPGVEYTINSLALGDDNFSAGISSLVTGTENKTFGRYNAAIGSSNNNYGYCSGVIGRNNSLNAQSSFIAGSFNKAEAPANNGCFILGGKDGAGNTITASETVAVGFSNKINKTYAMAIGLSNTIDKDHAMVIGVGNEIPSTTHVKTNSVVLGRYANVKTNAALTLGCGQFIKQTKIPKNVLWCDETTVKFDDLPVEISNLKNSNIANSTILNSSIDAKSNNLYINNICASLGGSPNLDNVSKCITVGNTNSIASGHNYCCLLGSWLTSSSIYQTILGVGNEPDPKKATGYADRGVIIGDGDYGTGEDKRRHNAIVVKAYQNGIEINSKTNFNAATTFKAVTNFNAATNFISDIYVKSASGDVIKLIFTKNADNTVTITTE